MKGLYLALVHYPVLDRVGDVITTAVTNLDVHDIARTARTYDASGYFVVSPIDAQRQLVERILHHWRDGSGARRVPERTEALARCEHANALEDVYRRIEEMEGMPAVRVATSARVGSNRTVVPYRQAQAGRAETPLLVLFGTGHGLAPEVLDDTSGVLPPIRPDASYNHLSVRAAVAITLDRLTGGASDPSSD